MTKSTW